MPTFSYLCVDDNGAELKGVAAAESEDQLVEVLRRQGHYLVRASAASRAGGGVMQARLFERITRRDVIFFTQQLATIMGTGVPLLEGLADIELQSKKQVMKGVVAALRRDVESGESLSSAMARHPQAFGELYVSIVKAGEASGSIDRALDDLVKQLEWQVDLSSRLREVSTYPILVVIMLAALSVVLVGFTIPRFMTIYERLNAQIELPLPTQMVMALSSVARGYWPTFVSGAIAIAVGVRMYRQTPEGAVRLSRWALALPVVGELLRKIALSRFAHYFATLHDSGLEVAPSLTLVRQLIGNAHLARQFDRAAQRVLAGESLSGALRAVGEFPPVVIQMIALGERTGKMSKALGDVRKYFDGEVDRTIKQALTYFGPLMLIVLAGAFVMMALAFYLPLFGLLRGLK
jgi:type IV pilus assembly protein PilC